MNYKYLSKEDQLTSHWSGGTTTQLFIYPAEADYKKLNFKFRISSAKVEVEESVFTKLDGIHRHLMILDGELKIAHEGHYETQLKAFEVDSFMGDWETKSKGCVTDFNLMLSAEMQGRLDQVHLDDQQSYSLDSDGYQYVGIYIWQGGISIENSDLRINQGDFLLWDLRESPAVLKMNSLQSDTIMILSFIAHR